MCERIRTQRKYSTLEQLSQPLSQFGRGALASLGGDEEPRAWEGGGAQQLDDGRCLTAALTTNFVRTASLLYLTS